MSRARWLSFLPRKPRSAERSKAVKRWQPRIRCKTALPQIALTKHSTCDIFRTWNDCARNAGARGGSEPGCGRPREPDGFGSVVRWDARRGGGLVSSSTVSAEVASP